MIGAMEGELPVTIEASNPHNCGCGRPVGHGGIRVAAIGSSGRGPIDSPATRHSTVKLDIDAGRQLPHLFAAWRQRQVGVE
jgi:hypothetical protein